jgi:hypothetical protein
MFYKKYPGERNHWHQLFFWIFCSYCILLISLNPSFFCKSVTILSDFNCCEVTKQIMTRYSLFYVLEYRFGAKKAHCKDSQYCSIIISTVLKYIDNLNKTFRRNCPFPIFCGEVNQTLFVFFKEFLLKH